jgi:uncharacterized metal-binding protein
MPNTPTHDFLTVATSLVMAPSIYSILRTAEVIQPSAVIVTTVIVVAHNVSGILFSPDLDLDSRIHKRWGFCCLFGSRTNGAFPIAIFGVTV